MALGRKCSVECSSKFRVPDSSAALRCIARALRSGIKASMASLGPPARSPSPRGSVDTAYDRPFEDGVPSGEEEPDLRSTSKKPGKQTTAAASAVRKRAATGAAAASSSSATTKNTSAALEAGAAIFGDALSDSDDEVKEVRATPAAVAYVSQYTIVTGCFSFVAAASLSSISNAAL
jgi:hypothetical protein